MHLPLLVRTLPGLQDYAATWQAMQQFTDTRQEDTLDEVWLLEHPPVFTQGQAGKAEHILNPGTIPVIQTDRGGQITYHGPGQLIMYVLFDLRRLHISIRQLVTQLETTVIQVLKACAIQAATKCDAPGVYVEDAKICSIGLRVRRGCSYHGIAFNIDMDLAPFTRINPCGFHNLAVTQVSQFNPHIKLPAIQSKIVSCLQRNFGYNQTTLV